MFNLIYRLFINCLSFQNFLSYLFIFFLGVNLLISKEQVSFENEDKLLIGNIISNQKFGFHPLIYCLEDEKSTYRGFTYRVKDLNLKLPESLTIPKKSNKEVFIILGKVKPNIYQNITKIGECDLDNFGGDLRFQQIRLDWLPTENRENTGMPINSIPGVTSKKRLEELSFFEVKSIHKAKILTFKKQKDDLLIKIKNPLSLTLKNVKLIAHYEGGRGKPMPHYKIIQISDISHKQIIRKTLPLSISDSEKRFYNLFEIQLSSEFDNIILDISTFIN
jgi:hypothetical protein